MRYLGMNHGNADYEGLRTLVLPSGIGEFQWVWTKLVNVAEDFCILGLDGAPRRLHQFAELHPKVKAFGYTAAFDYTRIRQWQDFHQLTSWEAITNKFALGQPTALACNPFLEAGNPLSMWLSDLPTTYSYPLALTEKHRQTALRYLQTATEGDMLIGLSCASYRGADAWQTWHAEEWITFLHLVQKEFPHARFALLGGSWDDLTAALFDEDLGIRWLTDLRGFPPVGRTEFGSAAALLEGLDGYIGFSSGLGHVALHNCGTPVFMLWPEHEQPLSRAWVDPTLLDNGMYVPSRWLSPEDVFAAAREWLLRVQEGRYAWSATP